MPELPEVETVRSGLLAHAAGRRIAAVEVLHPRAVRRHLPGEQHFAAALKDRTITGVNRRGKYLWLPLDDGDAILAHLGMSGQFRLAGAETPDEKHLRVRLAFADGDPQLRFVDQRTFGGLSLSEGGAELPPEIAHIARDPIDPGFDDDVFVAALRRRHVEVKRALLDQTLISGVATSTPTSRCGGPNCTVPGRPTRSPARPCTACSGMCATCWARRWRPAVPASTPCT